MIFGMGAGKDEERLRRCFVGRAGKYMRQIIKHLWDNVTGPFNLAISNNVRFHPMDPYGKDREPTREEIDYCIGYLENDIESLDPRVIIPVGINASRTFLTLDDNITMSRLRTMNFEMRIGTKVRQIKPTYHPSFLCRTYGSYKPEEENNFDAFFVNRIVSSLNLNQ